MKKYLIVIYKDQKETNDIPEIEQLIYTNEDEMFHFIESNVRSNKKFTVNKVWLVMDLS